MLVCISSSSPIRARLGEGLRASAFDELNSIWRSIWSLRSKFVTVWVSLHRENIDKVGLLRTQAEKKVCVVVEIFFRGHTPTTNWFARRGEKMWKSEEVDEDESCCYSSASFYNWKCASKFTQSRRIRQSISSLSIVIVDTKRVKMSRASVVSKKEIWRSRSEDDDVKKERETTKYF